MYEKNQLNCFVAIFVVSYTFLGDPKILKPSVLFLRLVYLSICSIDVCLVVLYRNRKEVIDNSLPQTPLETGGKPQMQILKCRDDRNPIAY